LTAVTRRELLEHLDRLRRVKDFPTDEDSAVRVVVRFYADRGFICTGSEARSIVADETRTD
jgi:hypothetical protein